MYLNISQQNRKSEYCKTSLWSLTILEYCPCLHVDSCYIPGKTEIPRDVPKHTKVSQSNFSYTGERWQKSLKLGHPISICFCAMLTKPQSNTWNFVGSCSSWQSVYLIQVHSVEESIKYSTADCPLKLVHLIIIKVIVLIRITSILLKA